jgi:hypothetical protein
MKGIIFILMLSSAYAYNLKQDIAVLKAKIQCSNFKKIKRSRIFKLKKSNNEAYEDYMNCKHFLKNEKAQFMLKCKQVNGNWRIKGLLSHLGKYSPYKSGFRYDVIRSENGLTILVKIHFRKDVMNQAIAAELYPQEYDGPISQMVTYRNLVDYYLSQASREWSENSPINYIKFKFIQVDSKKDSHFSVKMLDKIKGILYHNRWTIWAKEYQRRDEKRWWHKTYSHEIGHMLGLVDEYSIIRGMTQPGYFMWTKGYDLDCSASSVMCMPTVLYTVSEPALKLTHYYHVFKRLLKCD